MFYLLFGVVRYLSYTEIVLGTDFDLPAIRVLGPDAPLASARPSKSSVRRKRPHAA